ncbi:MAG: type II toxin-antitoxin system RelE/ParE family toxin [Proteobacteria bacterium]|nr:type II toxin-antitoxin system RelE/ParE family toxin [Pseudomonadota bacterium]
MRELILAKQAQIHLKNIRTYTVQKWGIKQSVKYLQELQQTTLILLNNPLIGHRHDDLNNDVFSFLHGSHVIYYKFNNKQLSVLDVLHKSMLPKKHLQDK